MSTPATLPVELGPVITGADVEAGVYRCLRSWLPLYLRHVEELKGEPEDTLGPVRGWHTAGELDKWPEDQLPAVIIVSPGLREEPDKDGSGFYRARWLVAVALLVSARTEARTRQLCHLYAAAIRSCVLQTLVLQDEPEAVYWRDESYDDLEPEAARSLSLAQLFFDVDVSDVAVDALGRGYGPIGPDPDPDYPPWPDVVDADLDVVKVPIDEELS